APAEAVVDPLGDHIDEIFPSPELGWMKHACRSPQQKSMLHVKFFFPSPVGFPKSTGGGGVKMWMHPGLQPVTTTHRDQSISVFNAQQGSRGNACTSSRGLVA